MNVEQALLNIKVFNRKHHRETFDLAIDALEKQIPKKSKCYEDKFIHCPSCGIGFGYKWECYPTKVNDYSHIQYCYGCGQKIDWGESE